MGPGKRRADHDHAVILVSIKGENYLQHGLDISISPRPGSGLHQSSGLPATS
jgi:hypothetical protein